MSFRFMKSRSFLFLLLLCLYSLCGQAYAIDVRIDPAKVRLSLAPGSSKSGQIKVANASADPIKFKVYLEDWKYVAPMDGSKEFMPAGTSALSCAKWINFTPNEFIIAPYGFQHISYSINVPPDAAGGYYTVVFFESLLGKVPDQGGKLVNASVRMASLFYVDVAGTVKRGSKLTSFVLENKKQGLEMKCELVNTGNTDFIGSGTFNIIDAEGNVYARGRFNDFYAFPGDTGKISAKSDSTLSEGVYDLIITLQAEGGLLQTFESKVNIGARGEVLEATQPE